MESGWKIDEDIHGERKILIIRYFYGISQYKKLYDKKKHTSTAKDLLSNYWFITNFKSFYKNYKVKLRFMSYFPFYWYYKYTYIHTIFNMYFLFLNLSTVEKK